VLRWCKVRISRAHARPPPPPPPSQLLTRPNSAPFQFLGLLGTLGNGQSLLISKTDLDAVWTDMLRLHKKTVRAAML
jgi:hypothetical protein